LKILGGLLCSFRKNFNVESALNQIKLYGTERCIMRDQVDKCNVISNNKRSVIFATS